MTELFEADLIEESSVVDADDIVDLVVTAEAEPVFLDARRRLEKILEDRRLREEIDDFLD